MHRNTKVATCCYCGTRAALVLDTGRHELSCRGCGAPLHELKAMPVKAGAAKEMSGPHRTPPHRWSDFEHARRPAKPIRKVKKRKSLSRRLFEEAFDLIEDIFD